MFLPLQNSEFVLLVDIPESKRNTNFINNDYTNFINIFLKLCTMMIYKYFYLTNFGKALN